MNLWTQSEFIEVSVVVSTILKVCCHSKS